MRSLPFKSQAPGELPDSVLIRRARTGDERAFESLVDRYYRPVLRYISSYLNDRDLASDVVQLVFLQLFVTLPTLLTERPVNAWLYTVARNCSLNELRKRQHEGSTVHFSALEQEYGGEKLSPLERIIDPHPLPEERVAWQDLRSPLQRALLTLPPANRVIVMWRSTEQLSFPEISCKLKLPESTVKARYYRSLLKLRAALKHDQAFFV